MFTIIDHNPPANRLPAMIAAPVLIVLLMLALSGCNSGLNPFAGDRANPDNDDASSMQTGDDGQTVLIGNESTLQDIDLEFIEGTPIQVNAIVRGTVPDACTSIEQIIQQRAVDTLFLNVVTARQTGGNCARQEAPFAEGLHLDLVGLPAGDYTVTALGINTVSSAFSIDEGQVIPASAGFESGGSIIEGQVWNDHCQDADGACTSDGRLGQGESPLAGVMVILKEGACPGSTVVKTVATNIEGRYEFLGLIAGNYCVTVDSNVEPNRAVLSGGTFEKSVAAEDGGAQAGLMVQAGERKNADFAWQVGAGLASETPSSAPAVTLASETTIEPGSCADAAAYVEDITIPDDTPVPPNTEFIKTWRVRNEGSCTWGPGYALLFDDGDQMGAPELVPIQAVVPPGREIDLSVPLTAPGDEGAYRGDWKIQNVDGDIFGSRGDYALYLQILVEEEAAAP
jgi:hypothetical protein